MQPTALNETQLPRAVRQQMERVNARHAERTAQRSAAAAPPPGNPDDAGAALTNTEGDPALASANAPVPNAPPPPTLPIPTAKPGSENDPVYWRERFSVMQGINEKLRKDHASDLRDRDHLNEELRQRVAELERQMAAKPATSGGDDFDLSLFFKPDQIDHFGEDQCRAMAQAAITAANTQVQAAIDAKVKPLEDESKATKVRKEQEAEEKFWSSLDELVPTWQEINAEAAWLEWLKLQDEDGEVRQARMNRHRNVRNAVGVANVFRDFLKTRHKPTPPVTPSGGAGGGGGGGEKPAATKGYPSREEIREHSRRVATIRNPRDPRFVTEAMRAEFDERLRLPKPQ